MFEPSNSADFYSMSDVSSFGFALTFLRGLEPAPVVDVAFGSELISQFFTLFTKLVDRHESKSSIFV